jgi:hypothetical protein
MICQFDPGAVDKAVTEQEGLHTSFLQAFPKWLRVARLWFEGVLS